MTAKYGAPPEDKRYSPLLFESNANLTQKAAFFVCGWDPRRDEALLFEQLLKEEKMGTKLYIYPGLPHGFWTTCPDLDVSKSWQIDLVEGVRFLLA
jgi:acetyl esterase/lipase